ncbi:MAG: response regulator [Candidatus Obscuribacterales bacterium]|jgi:two-component system, chemotaxis family, response regulator Rcp1|nr:response regulator [Candidatus Obscuribacterales bacterium]
MNKNLKVLLVEDNAADARLVKEALADCRIPVEMRQVENGEEALKYVNREGPYNEAPTPDLIVLDLNMPKKDGHGFLEEAKDVLDELDIPIVLLTVSDRDSDIKRALDTKMNFYLNKPVDASKLKAVLCAINDLWSIDAIPARLLA